jgi:hypothetical protein
VREYRRLRQAEIDEQLNALQAEEHEFLLFRDQLHPRFEPADELVLGPVDYRQTVPLSDPRIREINLASLTTLALETPLRPLPRMQPEFQEQHLPLEPVGPAPVRRGPEQPPREPAALAFSGPLPALSQAAVREALRPELRPKPLEQSRKVLYKQILMLVKLQYRVLDKEGNAEQLYADINALAKELRDDQFDKDIMAIVSRSFMHYQNYLKKQYV